MSLATIPITKLIREPKKVIQMAKNSKNPIAVMSHSQIAFYLADTKQKLQKLSPELNNIQLKAARRKDLDLNSDLEDTYRRVDIYDGKYD